MEEEKIEAIKNANCKLIKQAEKIEADLKNNILSKKCLNNDSIKLIKASIDELDELNLKYDLTLHETSGHVQNAQ